MDGVKIIEDYTVLSDLDFSNEYEKNQPESAIRHHGNFSSGTLIILDCSLDSNYRRSKRNFDISIEIYYRIKKLINTNPTYLHMKPHIDNMLSIYNISILMITVGSMDPIAIMMALYKLSCN